MFRRSLLVAFLGLLAAACGELDSEGTASAGFESVTHQQAITRVCGADRYTGPQGVDVSKYQGNYDWAAQKAAGVVFGIARVSDGTNTPDEYFDRNWTQMKTHGFYRGAYQYFRPGQDAVAQANMVVSKVGRLGPGDLPAVIDVESAGGQSPATIRNKIQQWLDIVEAGTGKKPMIYTAAYFWRDNVGEGYFTEYPLWVANYGATCPLTPDGWGKWTMWQYCDGNPDYCSNGQGFDRNVFNGTMAELEEFANGGADWAAEYVNQTFPLAAEPLVMVAGETTSGHIELKNTGKQAWDSNTKLATTEPRDRDSIFANDSWPAPNRPAAVEGTVAPNESYKFEFELTAPDEPGTYFEHFGVVQEGVSWFSDSGGPPDDQLQIQVQVVKAPYAARVTASSFGEQPVAIEVGKTLEAWVEVQNIGTEPWSSGVVMLAPTPRDGESPLYDAAWLSATRVSTVDGSIAPGGAFRFPLPLHGAAEGSVTQTFSFIAEGTGWFGDLPHGGGPADDAITVVANVHAPGEAPEPGENPEIPTGGEAPGGVDEHGLPPIVGPSPGIEGGCSHAGGRPEGFLIVLFGGLFAYGRRRR